MSLYRKIFKDSIKITWKNKYFWLLGIFTVFFSASVEIDMFGVFFGPKQNYLHEYKEILGDNFLKGGLFEQLKNISQLEAAFFYKATSIILVFLLILVVLLVFSSIAQIIITSNSASILKNNPDIGKSSKKFNLAEALKNAKNLIISISTINLALKIFINTVLILIILPMIIQNSSSTTWFNVILFLILFPLAVTVAFIVRYITCYIIIYGQRFKQAYKNSWILFKNNWLVSLEMSISLFLINIFGSLVIIFIILAIANPVWLLGVLINQYIYNGGFYVVLAVSYLVFFGLFALGASWLATFNIVAWTNLFLKINKNAADSKVFRILNDLTKNK